ncbi:MAG: CvpA family protein [Syntrophobacteraceae bacterium]|jgi:membrane protein required for colicin V production
MNILDWVLICIAAFWVLRGLMRGAISQIFGIAGILIGFLVASYHYEEVSVFIIGQFHSISGSAARPLSFVLLFLITWFIVGVVGFWIARLIRSVGLGFLDRLWGAMIGFGKALLFAIVVVSVLTLFSADGNPSLLAQSKLAPRIREASEFLFKLAPGRVQEELSKKRQDVKKLVNEGPSKVLDPFLGQSAPPDPKGKR